MPKLVPLPGVRSVTLPSGAVRYEATVNLGIGPDGRRRQQRRRFPTLRAANTWKSDQEARKRAGALTDDAGLTVERLCTRWLALPSPRRGDATRIAYRICLMRHVYPGLGSVRVERLTTARLQAHADGLLALGHPLPALRMAYKALSGALRQAVAWGMVGRNPMAGVVLATPQPAEAAILSLPQLARLLAAARTDARCGALLHLLATTGLRVGEAVALYWEDIDLERGALIVRRRLTRQDNGRSGVLVLADGAKSRSGLRGVALAPETVDVLRRHRATQNGWRLAAGEAWADHGLVFSREDGEPLGQQAPARALARACAAAGLERITCHALRHAHATHTGDLAGHDGLLALQRRLGHSDLSQTVAYTHPSVESQRPAAERFASRLRDEGA